MPARSKTGATARTTALVAPDAIGASDRSRIAARLDDIVGASALIVAFALVTLLLVRMLVAG